MSGVSTTSTTTLKTDVTSKVLPGDKSGLPLEIWQIIFSYLSVRDLCCVARVSKTWFDLSLSIDMTRWKELYLACPEWRHPYWPLNVRLEPSSWKMAYRNQHLSTRFWYCLSLQAHKAGCMTLLKRSRERQTIEVGPGLQHETLKSAFAVASEYDRILVHPGIYDEQIEMSAKVPFELMGSGELGSVILVICLEHVALTGRLSNLVLRAPWFSNFILKVKSGYLQIDNCIMEDGMMCVANPAACHIQFCTFRHATVILQHVNASIIRNCEFSQSDNANIVVEGYPKEEKSWAYPHLCQQMDTVFNHKQSTGHKHLLKVTDSTTSTLHSTFTGKSFTTSTIKTYDTMSRDCAVSQEAEYNGISNGVNSANTNSQRALNANMGAGNNLGVNGAYAKNHSAQSCRRINQVNGSAGLEGDIDSFVPLGALNTTNMATTSLNTFGASGGSNGAEAQKMNGANPVKSDSNQTEQQPGRECVSVLHSVPQEQEPQERGNLQHGGDSELHRNKSADDGEWLEIDDERKTWQMQMERGTEEEDTLQQSDLTAKECSKRESGSGEHLNVDAACTSAAGRLPERLDLQQRVTCNGTETSEGGSLVNSQKAKHSFQGSDLGNPCAGDSACKDQTLHAAKDSLGPGSKYGSVTTTVVGSLSDTGDSADVHKSRSLPRSNGAGLSGSEGEGFFSGDIFPQNLPPLNSSASRYHQHHPPLLQNPHPNPQSNHHSPGPQQPQAHNPNDQSSPRPQADQPELSPRSAEERGQDRRSERSFNSSRNGESTSDDDDDDLSILNDLESVGSRAGSNHGNHSSSSSDEDSEVEEFFRADSEYDCSDPEESVIMLPHLRQKHLEASLSANAVNADVGSICSQASRPITLSATQDQGVMSHVSRVRGCLIHQCRMMHSKGGVMVSLQAHALISGCDISNVSYGIRCIQNARVVVLKNRIHHCRTSGIFMRLAASGLIAGNDIHSNNEAGLDIRKNADPIVQHNRIHHGKRSGVVVLGSGRGQICSNNIYSNTEAGIYILYGGNPTVSENNIYDGRAAGVAVNEGGQGFIYDNTISSNQWGGVDIRRGSCPMVCRNTITNGLGDGIVIGDQGQGTIENNIISDNAGCGLWLMSASRPYIHGNQISNNGDTGVMMVNKTDIHHEGSHLLPAGAENVDHISRSLSMMGGLLDDVPTPQPKCAYTTLQHNNIYHNAGRGVAVELGDKVDVLYNAIYANQQDGVCIHQESPLTLHGNSISSNQGHGVVVSLTASMEITGNGIYDNRDCGIMCSGKVNIKENDIVCNQAGGVSVDDNSVTQIVGNRIQAPSGPTVKVAASDTDSLIEGNRFCYSVSGEVVDLSQRAIVRDNRVMYPTPVRDKAASSSRHRSNKDGIFNKSHFLRDPPPRPLIHPPPPPSDLPTHNISSVTKVVVPSGETCQQGSKLCTVL